MRLIAVAAAVLAVLSLAQCAKEAPPPPQTIGFEGPPINLDVARIDVVTEFTSPLKKPNVDYMMPIPPASAAKRWAEERFKAAGASGSARLTIQDASVIETPLPRKEALGGLVTVSQDSRYDGTLAVTLEILDDRGFPVGSANANATRSRSLPDKASLNQRDQLYYDLTSELVHDVDTVMAKQVADNLPRFIRQ